jgi:hypothetical protein
MATKRFKNVAMGFRDEYGVFHPIRASKDYNEFLTTDVASRAEKKRRAEEHDDRKRRARYFKEAQQERKKKETRISLAQFVRRRGGIRPTEDLAGEVRRLSQRETGTSGLVNRRGGRFNTPDYMREKANEAGYRNRDGHKFRTPAEFLEAVERDATSSRKFYAMENPARKKNKAASKRKVRETPLFSMFAQEAAKDKPGEKSRRVKMNDNGREGEIVRRGPTGWVKIKMDDSDYFLHAAPGTYRLINGRGKRVVIVMKKTSAKKNSAKKKVNSSKKSNGILSAVGGALKRRRARGKARRALTRELKAERRLQVARQKRTAAQRAALSNTAKKKNTAKRATKSNSSAKRNPAASPAAERRAFEAGYKFGRLQKITLSPRQIAEKFPRFTAGQQAAFQQGTIDGVAGDQFRLRLGRKLAKKVARKPNLTINVRETKIITKGKRKRNTASTDRLYKEFQGREPNGTVKEYLGPNGIPKDASLLGPIVDIEFADGPHRRLIFNERLANASRSLSQAQMRTAYNRPRAVLAQAQVGGRRRLYVLLREPQRLPNGESVTRPVKLGECKAVTYVARKDHLYGPGSGHVMHRHAYGDRGGNRPSLFINAAGMLDHRGGDYTVRAEGIDN